MATGALTVKRAPAWVRVPLEYAAFWLGLTLFGAFGLAYTAVSPLLCRLLPRRLGSRIGQRALSTSFRWILGLWRILGLIRCDLAALDALSTQPPAIIVANHPALIDAMLVASRLPNVVCIMKADVLENPVLCGGARFAGYLRADKPIELIHAASAALQDGRHVLVFPEGTRTVRHPVNRFHGLFSLIARHSGAPIQTVLLETKSSYLGKGEPLFRKPVFPLEFRARLGRRFVAGGNAQALVAEVEAYYTTELGDRSRVV